MGSPIVEREKSKHVGTIANKGLRWLGGQITLKISNEVTRVNSAHHTAMIIEASGNEVGRVLRLDGEVVTVIDRPGGQIQEITIGLQAGTDADLVYNGLLVDTGRSGNVVIALSHNLITKNYLGGHIWFQQIIGSMFNRTIFLFEL